MNSTELRERRAALIAEARQLYEERSTEGTMSAEDTAQWDRLMDRADQLRADAERIERMEAVEQDLEERANDPIRPEPEQADA